MSKPLEPLMHNTFYTNKLAYKPKLKIGDWIKWDDFNIIAEITKVDLFNAIYDYKFIVHYDAGSMGQSTRYDAEFIDNNIRKYSKPINYNDYWAKLNEVEPIGN